MSDVIERMDTAIVHPLTGAAARYASASKGAGTRQAYAKGWKRFLAWCTAERQEPFGGAPTVALYITALAEGGKAVSTIGVRLAAIKQAYQDAGVSLDMDDAELAAVRQGITRTLGAAPRRKAAPALSDVLARMVATCSPAVLPRGARDRAMLVMGFAAALRRSELIALTIGDVDEVPGRGLLLTIRRSKTDQDGQGDVVAIAQNPANPDLCPVQAWKAWMRFRLAFSDAGRSGGPLFCGIDRYGNATCERMHENSVKDLVKRAADAAGLAAELYSCHSLRRGLLTDAAERGADLLELMRHARHKTPKVTKGYVDAANAWTNNASSRVFGNA